MRALSLARAPRLFSHASALLTAIAAASVSTAALATTPLPQLPPAGAPIDGAYATSATPVNIPPNTAYVPVPGATAPAAANANASASAAPSAGARAAARGVVQVLRGGHGVALGAVLGRDGRVITALSALGGSETADVRYADGTVAHAKLGHFDPEWDLALLVPQNGPKWTEGLAASEADPGGAELRAFANAAVAAAIAAHGKALTAETPAPFQGRSDVHAKDGTLVHDALDLEAKTAALGSPVIDANGAVVALLVHACKDMAAAGAGDKQLVVVNGKLEIKATGSGAGASKAASHFVCAPLTIGAPVAALRNFLIRTPSTAVAPAPWLGIVGEIERAGAVNGVRVLAVAPDSPANKSGLRPSSDAAKADVVTAVDGVPVDTPEKLSEEIAKHAIGQKIQLLVFKDAKLREVPVTLRAAP